MSYWEGSGVPIGVGVDAKNFIGVGAGVTKPETGAESEKCCSAHFWNRPLTTKLGFRAKSGNANLTAE